ncbi:hypothetical protein [Paraburkholderia caribensis]|uniref:Uncharacterized protein n=1 Tax=Paraburkholderia caribensis TaxID=75105 RepID=A0ABV0DSZ2_9BURK|nr:hypothetical protein [Paraburkholderia caribensis]MDR6384560.1 hypothetical protein [Paraburkholderia caribensis]
MLSSTTPMPSAAAEMPSAARSNDYLSGEVEHQDCILDAADQQNFLTLCVSRAKSELLVLDL